jgi:histidyl-tRNA synthetase
MEKFVVGNRTLRVRDVMSLAFLGSSPSAPAVPVVVDPAALDALRKLKAGKEETPFVAPTEGLDDESDDDWLPPSNVWVRSLLIAQTHRLLQTRSARTHTISILCALLSKNIIPALTHAHYGSSKSLLGQVFDVLTGAGLCYIPTEENEVGAMRLEDTVTAFSRFNIEPLPNPTMKDKEDFCSTDVPLLALCILLTQGGAFVAKLAQLVTALTCEALGVGAKAFQYSGDHRDIMRTMEAMRLVLDGSHRPTQTSPVDEITVEKIVQFSAQLAIVNKEILDLKKMVEQEMNPSIAIMSAGTSRRTAPSLVRVSVEILSSLLGLWSCARFRSGFVSSPSDIDVPYTPRESEEEDLFQRLGKEIPMWMVLHSVVTDGDEFLQEGVAWALEGLSGVVDELFSECRLSSDVLSKKEAELLEKKMKKEEERMKKLKDKEEKEAADGVEGEEKDSRKAQKTKKISKKKKKESEKPKKEKEVLVLGKGSRGFLSFWNDVLSELNAIDACWASYDLLSNMEECLQVEGKKRKPKIPKGTRDFDERQMAIREKAFKIITGVFKRHGAVTIDTPVFELRETLMGKYGEDSKLIYDLADQGGEILSLRYDLTVPFARYVAMNSISSIKRYQIARVYRRDQPVMTKGKYREFYQCDFDIAGNYPLMIPDAEVLCVVAEILDELPIGAYVVKINHRVLLDAILDICGVPAAKFRMICSAIDKLDKSPWEEVYNEMVQDKGLPPDSASKIGEYVRLSGPCREMLEKLRSHEEFVSHPRASQALDEMDRLFGFLEAFNVTDRFSFDLSLARGLDYYTGVIYEAVMNGEFAVGSIAGGGRYDNLVGMFSATSKCIPAVGVSIGIERVFAIMLAQEESKKKEDAIRTTETSVLVCSAGSSSKKGDRGFLAARMEICRRLWAGGVAAEYLYSENPNMKKQIECVTDSRIPFMAIVGEDELARGVVKVKDVESKEQIEVALDDLVDLIKSKLTHS